MISVKGGTQTWSTSQQKTDFKSDNKQTVSANDKDKFFNDQDIGDVLNKVADPNYIDTSKKARSVGNSELDKDAFMTLLLTQMKNQDPTNPLKSHEMAAQLAQFTSLEKLHNINESVAGLRNDQKPNQNFEALSFIGKVVSTDNGKIIRTDAKSQHDVRFNLGSDATSVKMKVVDAAGNEVRNIEYKNIKKGANELQWNGLTDEGAAAPIGDYTLQFEAVASNGKKIAVETKTEGVISGVNFTPRGPQLMIGKQVINIGDIKSISDPNAGQPSLEQVLAGLTGGAPSDAQGPTAAAPALMGGAAPKTLANSAHPEPVMKKEKMMPLKPESKGDGAKRARLAQGDLNEMAMEQGLINVLNKTGAKAGMEGQGI